METENYKEWIESEHKLLSLNLKEIIQYRDLLFLLVKRDFVAIYKQTILGPAWAVIQPLLNTVVFTLIFGKLANLSTCDSPDSVLPGFLFYMAGNICWSYFSTALTSISSTFIVNANTMGKVYYPRMIMPISTAFSKMIAFVIQFALFVAIYIIYAIMGGIDFKFGPHLLLIIPTIIQMMLLSIGFGIVISAFTTKYRDLTFTLSFFVQVWQYASPVVYGLTLITSEHSHWLWLYMLNPMTPILTTFRFSVFGSGYFSLGYYLLSWAEILVFCFVGLILFSKIERTFIDTI